MEGQTKRAGILEQLLSSRQRDRVKGTSSWSVIHRPAAAGFVLFGRQRHTSHPLLAMVSRRRNSSVRVAVTVGFPELCPSSLAVLNKRSVSAVCEYVEYVYIRALIS